MVRSGYIIAAALALLTTVAFSQNQPPGQEFVEYVKRLQMYEQKIALFAAAADAKQLIQTAKDIQGVAEFFAKHDNNPAAYSCGFASVRLISFTLSIASGRGLQSNREKQDYNTLISVCEKSLEIPAPSIPNLR